MATNHSPLHSLHTLPCKPPLQALYPPHIYPNPPSSPLHNMSASPELYVPPEPPTRPLEEHGVALSTAKDGESDDRDCRTPTAKESRLVSIPSSCPPAPRKLRPVIRCKRRLSELEYYVVGSEELERLFRRREQLMIGASPARNNNLKKAKV